MLIQCFDSTNSIWSFHFVVSGFSNAKIFSFQTAEPSVHKKSSVVRTNEAYPFTKNIHPFDSRSQIALLIPSNGLSTALVSLSSLKRHKQINPKYPFIAFQVEKQNIKDICNHLIIQPLGRTGKVISSKENFQSTNYMAKVTALSCRESKQTLF